MQIIEGLYYTRDHEWVRVEGAEAYIGITDYAQQALGDIVYVELSEIGTVLNQEETFGTVESVKAASDMYIPVSGTVTRTNEDLADNPALVNDDPFGTWMVCVEMSNTKELEQLLSASAYKELCSEVE